MNECLPRELRDALDQGQVPPELVQPLEALYERNVHQWELEDASRAASSLKEVGRIKKLIDKSNQLRVAIINAIDQEPAFSASEQATPRPFPLTLGQLLDSLSIVAVKLSKTRNRSSVETLRHLLDCLSFQIEMLRRGEALLPPSTEKFYGATSLKLEPNLHVKG